MSVAIFESLSVLLILVGLAVGLRHRGILDKSDAPTLAKLITDFVLPALVFLSLSRHSIELHHLIPTLIMLSSTLIILALAWRIGKWMGLEPKRLGAFILVAGIGSSSTLGYTLVSQVFPDNPDALFTAVMIGEVGVILPLFLIGIPIAIHFGGLTSKTGIHKEELRTFLTSPIFISIFMGLAVSWTGIPDSRAIKIIYEALNLIGNALPMLVALSIGLMLRPVSPRQIWAPILAVLCIKLALEPFLVAELALLDQRDDLDRNILVIEAAMPSGTIAAIIATRFGCDGGFASALVIVTYVASLFTIPAITALTAF